MINFVKYLAPIILITFILSLESCNSSQNEIERSKGNEKQSTQTVQSKNSIDSAEVLKTEDAPELRKIETFSSIVKSERDKVFKNKIEQQSLTFTHEYSINRYNYLKFLDEEFGIDSVYFLHVDNFQYRNPSHFPLHSAMLIYLENNEAKRVLDTLNLNWRDHARDVESIFKSGGIAFELENALCLYAVNTCGPGYRNLKRIDSIIRKDVFNDSSFYRLHAGCGMGPFRQLNN